MRRFSFFVLLVVVAAVVIDATAIAWQAPVSTPVVDQWRPPESRYAAGNRGVDFAPAAGTPVQAAGSGTVTFAGDVGGTRYVVVGHEGQLRTTYGGLQSIGVKVGQTVGIGQVVGLAGEGLHFGLRHRDDYIDPNSLFGRAQLVPLDPG